MKPRTINEIAEFIKQKFMSNSFIRNFYGLSQIVTNPVNEFDERFSPASIEAQFVIVLAISIATLENMFFWFKEDVEYMIEQERYGHAGWYKKMALKFQYGQGINPHYGPDSDSDFAESSIYEFEDDNLKPVKFAYASTASIHENGVGVLIKIATLQDGVLQPLSSEIADVFKRYMNRIKPAGVPLYIVNEDADKLILTIVVYYNPLVMRNNGNLIADDSNPVKLAIYQYLNSIEFNGEFSTTALIDSIQAIYGVEAAEITSSQSQRASNDPESFDAICVPHSGYFRLESNDLTVIYRAKTH